MATAIQQTYQKLEWQTNMDALDYEVNKDIHFGYGLDKVREADLKGGIPSVKFREWTLTNEDTYNGVSVSRAERFFITAATEGHMRPFKELLAYYSNAPLDGIIRNAYIKAKLWRYDGEHLNGIRTYIEENYPNLLQPFQYSSIGPESKFLPVTLNIIYRGKIPEQINLLPLGLRDNRPDLNMLLQRLGIDVKKSNPSDQCSIIEASMPQLSSDEYYYLSYVLKPLTDWICAQCESKSKSKSKSNDKGKTDGKTDAKTDAKTDGKTDGNNESQ